MPRDEVMIERANALIERLGTFRTRDAERELIPKHWLYRLERLGVVRQLRRGLWTDSDFWPDESDIARAVLSHAPRCLLSALHAYGLGEEPYLLWVAIGHSDRIPSLNLPVRYVRMSGASCREGVVSLSWKSACFRAYDLEKTLADCLKFRRAIGERFADLAVRRALATGRVNRGRFEHYAGICRVRSLIAPYLLLF